MLWPRAAVSVNPARAGAAFTVDFTRRDCQRQKC
jgi:hypothetical protein